MELSLNQKSFPTFLQPYLGSVDSHLMSQHWEDNISSSMGICTYCFLQCYNLLCLVGPKLLTSWHWHQLKYPLIIQSQAGWRHLRLASSATETFAPAMTMTFLLCLFSSLSKVSWMCETITWAPCLVAVPKIHIHLHTCAWVHVHTHTHTHRIKVPILSVFWICQSRVILTVWINIFPPCSKWDNFITLFYGEKI